MDKRKIAGEYDKIAGWTDGEVDQLVLNFLYKMFECHDADGVDVTVAYARYMSKVQLNPDNYPVFMKLLKTENHWVVDSLVSDKNPTDFLKDVQPNTFLLSECFKIFKKWKPRGIYPVSLLVLFGILKVAYSNPYAGYRNYPLSIPDINNFGKHLDKTKDQTDAVNKAILDILDSIASLNDTGGLPPLDNNMYIVAVQANNIRGKFLDKTKHLNEAIPDELLKGDDGAKKEIPPSSSPKTTKEKA